MIDKQHDGFIQELRGVAVLLVVAYHFFEKLVPLGYLGVDLFFGISGFVITSSLIRREDYNLSGLRGFYLRRIERLLPSLNLMIFFTLICVMLFFSPKLQRSIAIETVAAVFALSNIYFLETIDYFSGSGILRPLLHTWSLGVEEQVYLFFPVLVAFIGSVALKARGKLLIAVIGSLTFLSFSLFFYYSFFEMASLAFYSPLSRFWQFGLGALIALTDLRSCWSFTRNVPWVNNMLLGFVPVALVYVGFKLEDSANNAFVLSVVVSATSILMFCISSRVSHLSWLRIIGDRSYSIYLWHWPAFVIVSYINAYKQPLPIILISIVGTCFMAELSYRFIERDHHKKRYLKTLVFLLICLNIITASVLYSTANVRGQRIGTLESRAPCLVTDDISWSQRAELRCIATLSPSNSVYLWGSSHLAHYEPSISESYRSKSVQKLLTQGCPPLVGFGTVSCQMFNESVFKNLNAHAGARIILGANWENHANDVKFYDSLNSTLSRLKALELEIFLIGQIPTFAVDVPSYIHANPEVQHLPTVSSERLQAELRKLTLLNNGTFLDFMTSLCDESGCRVQIDGQVLYEDETHLSEYGSMFLLRSNKI